MPAKMMQKIMRPLYLLWLATISEQHKDEDEEKTKARLRIRYLLVINLKDFQKHACVLSSS